MVDEAPDFPPSTFGSLSGAGDQYTFTSGPLMSMRGRFTVSESGEIVSVDSVSRAYRHVA